MDRPISLQGAINAIKNADVCMAWNGEISAEDAADIAVRATKSSVVDSVEELPSAQPEITDCEYCHEDFDGYVRPIEKNSHAWLVRRGRTMKLRVCFKGGYSECDILFCPMCGRRLGGQNR